MKRPEPVPEGEPDGYAYVTVTSPGTLEDLTRAIGAEPDEGWDRSDLRRNGRAYGFSRWSLFSGLPRGAPFNDHVGAVLDRIEAANAQVFCLPSECEAYVSVTGRFADPDEIVGISARNHRRAAGLVWDFDFYFEGM